MNYPSATWSQVFNYFTFSVEIKFVYLSRLHKIILSLVNSKIVNPNILFEYKSSNIYWNSFFLQLFFKEILLKKKKIWNHVIHLNYAEIRLKMCKIFKCRSKTILIKILILQKHQHHLYENAWNSYSYEILIPSTNS